MAERKRVHKRRPTRWHPAFARGRHAQWPSPAPSLDFAGEDLMGQNLTVGSIFQDRDGRSFRVTAIDSEKFIITVASADA